MKDVSRETLLTIGSYLDLESLWFKDIFPEGNAWAVLQSKHKELWLQNFIDQKKYLNLHGTQLQGNGLVNKDIVLQHDNAEKSYIKAGAIIVDNNIVMMPGCTVEAGAYITGPTVFGHNTTVRHTAYIRGGVLTGKNCIIGHATEVKSSIFANDAKAAHFAYVGDSVLGSGVNLGAGTKLSNLKIVPGTVQLKVDDKNVDTGLRKFGAILGDTSQTGCNSVLNPGVILGKKSLVYPCAAVKKGLYKAKSLIK